MIRDHFRVMVVDLGQGRARVERVEGRDRYAGGSGLAALLFGLYGRADRPWDDPDQPFILAIGPLTGYFPLMSKTVAAFKSPYHDQYAESHAGGRSALAMRFADLDALVLVGRSDRPCCVSVGARHMEIMDAHFLWGKDVLVSGKYLRRMFPGSGNRSILRIGPAGERRSAMACVNVDTFRHFGRLGAGAVLGAKKVKAVAIGGDAAFDLPPGKEYAKLFKEIYTQLTNTHMMGKYHSLGTAGNMAALNTAKALPWRNLQQTSDPAIEGISGERFADQTLLRNAACAGCPVGCIHVGFVREKFMTDNQYLYRQVPYDYEPIFSTGSMLGVTNAFDVLKIMDSVERMGLDVMSAGVALAWAAEASEKGLIGPDQTGEALRFGDAEAFRRAVERLGRAENDFYARLAQGALVAAEEYGGRDFACVLGQEMAGYATGEVFFVAEALGFRHSHLDTSAYSFEQKHLDRDLERDVAFLVSNEPERVFLNCMVACLFSRGVYKDELLAEALRCVGYKGLAENMGRVAEDMRRLRWRTRLRTGYDPEEARIPKRFSEVVSAKGPVDAGYMERLRRAYAEAIRELGREEPEQ
ncbi:MAG: aldehyde ferredoxin oxidoreductase [Desulfovibrionaceae bacterium]|nr:aldehyde ferredoxin oxidoreductase [Desulfovibrionaceae bacterium]